LCTLLSHQASIHTLKLLTAEYLFFWMLSNNIDQLIQKLLRNTYTQIWRGRVGLLAFPFREGSWVKNVDPMIQREDKRVGIPRCVAIQQHAKMGQKRINSANTIRRNQTNRWAASGTCLRRCLSYLAQLLLTSICTEASVYTPQLTGPSNRKYMGSNTQNSWMLYKYRLIASFSCDPQFYYERLLV
jgi:hypothetical protein